MILRVQTAEDNTTLRTSRANMSPTVFILLPLLLGVSHALLKVHVEPNVVAAPGATVQLKCLLQEVKDPLDLKDLMILWFTRGIQVAEFDKTITIDKPGMSMSLEALKKGDATLTIQSFSPEHAGNYRCHVFYKSENTMRQTVLSSNVAVTPDPQEGDVALSTCETVLDKKLDKVVDWISKVEGRLAEVTQNCSPKQDKTRAN
ncbi:uncharacterized protein [Engystomops pustulosus]|uniref:uncharacterized protein n=1 Tax=Engystomops pustulosus TaxID=76066 RepID=UPI003AFA054B